MEVNVDNEENIVEIWLRRSEADDNSLRQSLKPKIAEYKRQNFLVVVYESGEADLFETTKELLQHNLKLSVAKAAGGEAST